MKIIDAHAHLFERLTGMTKGLPVVSEGYGKVRIDNKVNQLLPPSFEMNRSTIDTYLAFMEWCGVEKAVLLPNILYGYHNDYYITVVSKYPECFRAVALVDVVKGQEVLHELEDYFTKHNLCGLKIETVSAFQCAKETKLDTEALLPIWALCDDLEKAVFLHISRKYDLESLHNLVRRYSRITYIICHIGAEVTMKQGQTVPTMDILFEQTKSHNHMLIDFTSVPYYLQEAEYPFPRSCALIHRLYQEVGPEKMLWGSDYPGMLTMATYRQLISMVKEHVSIPANHKEMIMGQNAERLFWA